MRARSSTSANNAEPETVALAVLDASERAVRNCSPNYGDKRDEDAQFMDCCMEKTKSRCRTLKRQAAALWRPEFTQMLEGCHSIALERVDIDEKEGVRTQKMKCMACGRWEHCCKYMLHAVGPFNNAGFNFDRTSKLHEEWTTFIQQYESVLCDDFVEYTRRNHLPTQDRGAYSIGSTCLRKAELYFLTNTLMLELCYDAHQVCREKKILTVDTLPPTQDPYFKWYYARQDEEKGKKEDEDEDEEPLNNVTPFLEKLSGLELAIADEKRSVPRWGTDQTLWDAIRLARMKAAGNDEGELLELLRKRANAMLARDEPELEEVDNEVEQNSNVRDIEIYDSDDGNQCIKARARKRRCRPIIVNDESDASEVEACAPSRKTNARQTRGSVSAPRRRSRRQQQLAPEDADFLDGPRNEGRNVCPETQGDETEDEIEETEDEVEEMGEEAEETEEEVEEAEEEVEETEEEEKEEKDRRVDKNTARGASRRSAPSAFNMAQEQRVPGGRLPARRAALLNLGTLQLKLLREGRDDDSAICTSGMFVIQELLSRVDQLAHSLEQ